MPLSIGNSTQKVPMPSATEHSHAPPTSANTSGKDVGQPIAVHAKKGIGHVNGKEYMLISPLIMRGQQTPKQSEAQRIGLRAVLDAKTF